MKGLVTILLIVATIVTINLITGCGRIEERSSSNNLVQEIEVIPITVKPIEVREIEIVP